MPHHLHLIVMPQRITLERAMQFIKGSADSLTDACAIFRNLSHIVST